MRKSIVIIFIALALIIVAGVFNYAFTQMQKAQTGIKIVVERSRINELQIRDYKTEGWSVYRNDNFGIEMKIPVGWDPFEDSLQGDVFYSFIFGSQSLQPTGDDFQFLLSKEQLVDGENLIDWFSLNAKFTEQSSEGLIEIANKEYGEGFLSFSDYSVEINSVEVDESEAIMQTITCLKEECLFLGMPQHRRTYYVENDGVIYVVGVKTINPELDYGVLDLIVSTVTFIIDDIGMENNNDNDKEMQEI